jgi:hypothetical protein
MKEENPDSERILESAVRDSQVFHRCLVSEQPILQAKKSLKFD